MKDFENDLIYYPKSGNPVKEPRFILKSVDELEKSTNTVLPAMEQSVWYTIQIRLTML